MRDPLPRQQFAGLAALARVLRRWWLAGPAFARLAADADLRARRRLVALLWPDRRATLGRASNWPRKGRRLLQLEAAVTQRDRLLCLFPFVNETQILALQAV